MSSTTRQQIAEEAARIMLEHGERDFQSAKLKAAKASGLIDQSALPSNQEIEEQIKQRQVIFTPDTHKALIYNKRLQAQNAMIFFRDFNPHLTGAVFDGTASKYSPLEIHLFVDTVEEVTIFLLEHNAPFQLSERKLRLGKNEEITVPMLRFYADEQEVEVTVFLPKYKNHSPISSIDGAPQRRANLKKLQKVMESDSV